MFLYASFGVLHRSRKDAASERGASLYSLCYRNTDAYLKFLVSIGVKDISLSLVVLPVSTYYGSNNVHIAHACTRVCVVTKLICSSVKGNNSTWRPFYPRNCLFDRPVQHSLYVAATKLPAFTY